MNPAQHGIELLVASAQEYAPSTVGDGVARLEGLGLFVDIRQVQAMQVPSMAVFISEVNASPRERQKGITITCVGRAGDMPSAVADAVVQWVLGVLPVLAQWRGKHTCFSTSRQIETQGGAFDLLTGPLIVRGRSEADAEHATEGMRFPEPLLDVLRSRRLAPRVHWLELFACKFQDGSVDATCRLNNRDWAVGKKVLLALASTWPTTQEPMQSCRQFALLLPKNGNTQDILQPTLWARLSGRA
jgi:hypothetical protein